MEIMGLYNSLICKIHSVDSGSVISGLGNPLTPILQESLDCRGDESNLLDCPRLLSRRRKRQEPICGGVRCAGIHSEIRILLDYWLI